MYLRFRQLLKMATFLFAYAAGLQGILSLQAGSSISPLVWVPGGVALAFILIEGTRYWPVLFIGGFIASWQLNHPPIVGLAIGAGAFVSTYIARRMLHATYVYDTNLAKLRDVISFVSGAAVFSSMAGALVGTFILFQGNFIVREQLTSTVFMWFAGQLLGSQVITPFLLSLYNFNWKANLRDHRIFESLFVFSILIVVCLLIFTSKAGGDSIVPTLPYLVFPFVIWGALRLGMLGNATMNLLIGAFTFWATTHGLGPFTTATAVENSFISQGFVFILSLTGLIISSATAERQTALEERAEAFSERQKIQVYTEAMRESEAFLSSVIDNIPNLVFVKDAKDLRFVRLNKALEDLVGFSRHELIGKNDYDFFPREQADHFTANDRAVLNLGMLVDIPEEVISTRYKGERLLHTRKIPIFDPKSGEPVFLLGISEDITETKKAEMYRTKLQTEAKAAELASQTKSLFLANMSHEIRTPLGAILGFTNLLRDPNLSPTERESFFEVINRNGRALSQLIDDILDLSKVEAGRLDIEAIPTNVRELISDVRSLMELRAQQKGLALGVVTSPSLPDYIHTDPNRLRQILVNIIGNAIKFTEFGEVTIRVTTDIDSKGHQRIVFAIQDTGPGIKPAQAQRLFTWFTQADASTTRKYGGTGLGLALSRRLAKSLGGDVFLQSSTEDGSCFVVTVATHNEKQSAQEAAPNVGRSMNTLNKTGEDRLRGLRILLVEDAADNRILVERLLQKKGMIVDTAQNGREGIEMAMKNNYHLILMDVQMPVLGGLEATEELRRNGLSTPIIALTAHAMKEERERTKAAGCNAHLTKPIDIPELFQTLYDFTINGPVALAPSRGAIPATPP